MHQYIDRTSGKVVTETLFKDDMVNTIYSTLRERGRMAFDLLVSPRMSSLIAWVVFDFPALSIMRYGTSLKRWASSCRSLAGSLNIRWEECLEPEQLNTPRKLFERKIRYWECRPMDPDEQVVVSPADSRMFPGSFRETSSLFLKEKFFSYVELLGANKEEWLEAFTDGDYAIFRLTPDKYHWNHVPVSGIVRDFYEIEGSCHSCNPGAVVKEVTPYSKNHRSVTIIDTDVEGGSRVGLLAMIEVAALMIGGIVQLYCEKKYDHPVRVEPGLFVKKGQPKSLYRPGSSVDVLIFQKERIRFSEDLVSNSRRMDVQSRFSEPFGRPIVETDLHVRSTIGRGI